MKWVTKFLFVLSLIVLGMYLFTGDRFIDDSVLLLSILVGFVLSFVFSLVGFRNSKDKMVLWGSGIVLLGITIFFILGAFFWNQP